MPFGCFKLDEGQFRSMLQHDVASELKVAAEFWINTEHVKHNSCMGKSLLFFSRLPLKFDLCMKEKQLILDGILRQEYLLF